MIPTDRSRFSIYEAGLPRAVLFPCSPKIHVTFTLFSLFLSLSYFFFFFLQTRRLLFRAASPRGLFSSLFFLFFFLNFFRTCTRVIRTSDMRNERERASRKDICAHVDGAAS